MSRGILKGWSRFSMLIIMTSTKTWTPSTSSATLENIFEWARCWLGTVWSRGWVLKVGVVNQAVPVPVARPTTKEWALLSSRIRYCRDMIFIGYIMIANVTSNSAEVTNGVISRLESILFGGLMRRRGVWVKEEKVMVWIIIRVVFLLEEEDRQRGRWRYLGWQYLS